MIKPILDPEFKPAIIEIRKFNEAVKKADKKQHIIIAVERNNGYVYRKEFDIFADGENDEWNTFIAERYIKTILWVVGGYKIYIAGSKTVYQNIKDYYRVGGLREFDYNFMSTCFEKEVEVVESTPETIPQMNECSVKAGGNLNGRRIGFDAGGSDRKVSAVINGETVYSEETVWFPKLQEDINYHYEGIFQCFFACSYLI